MKSTNEIGLATERIQCLTPIDLNELHCSAICENILWKPVACQQCETHFCSMCIRQWLNKNPNQCPMRCDSFVQRSCSKIIARQLAKLQVSCIYQSNGCNEVIPYEALEKHEMTCEYQLVKCTGCFLELLKKNLAEHQSQCPTIVTTGVESKIVHQQNDVEQHHSDVLYLKEQLRQVRQESQYEIQQLKEQIREAQNDQISLLASRGVIVDDNNDLMKRIHIKSTVEIDMLDRNRIVLDRKSSSVLNDAVLCAECGNVLWSPVSCRKCRANFCKKCRPSSGILGKITTFFKSQRPQHGMNNCEKFEEMPVSGQSIADLTNLRVRCAYAPNGCRIISFYYDLERHEKTCEFEMIPCRICQLPLSKRTPIVEHTLRACFEHMRNKNPAGIQEQFMILFNAMEEGKANNRRLQSTIENIQTEVKHLNSITVKNNNTDNK